LFRVKVRDRSGRWSDEQQLAFRILPPLWQRGWFIALVATFIVTLAASLAWAAARWRGRRQLAALKLEQALASERARIARDLHDQLGSGLTDIAFLGDALRMDSASAEAAEVSTRARELTRAMDETVWALNPEKDTFQSLISYLGHALPGWLRPAGIRCRLDLPDESVRFGLSTRVRQQLFLACKEAVHNAVKHSGATLVTLRIEQTDHELVIILDDDGRGFDPATARAGHGLANLRHRLHDLGGTVQIDGAPGRGTTVVFRLSLSSLS
jgi:signal transduction histidine kinase